MPLPWIRYRCPCRSPARSTRDFHSNRTASASNPEPTDSSPSHTAARWSLSSSLNSLLAVRVASFVCPTRICGFPTPGSISIKFAAIDIRQVLRIRRPLHPARRRSRQWAMTKDLLNRQLFADSCPCAPNADKRWPSTQSQASRQKTSRNFLQAGTTRLGSGLWACRDPVYPSKRRLIVTAIHTLNAPGASILPCGRRSFASCPGRHPKSDATSASRAASSSAASKTTS